MLLVRKQFRFKIAVCKFQKLLKSLADCKINIVAINVQNYKCDKYKVHIIVGITDSTKKDCEWNKLFKYYLKCLEVCDYKTNKVIQKFPCSNSTYSFKKDNKELKCIKIYNIYNAKCNSIIYDVSSCDLDKAICLLK